jgi:hypothetical protein
VSALALAVGVVLVTKFRDRHTVAD